MQMAVVVQWPSVVARQAEIWRILDLSGLTKSVRESRNFTKAGFVFLNGNRVHGLKAAVQVNNTFTLELRFPNKRVKSLDITLVNRPFGRRTARQNSAPELRYKG